MLLIGIDPGRNTGIAIYNKAERKLERVFSLSFWEAIKFLEQFEGRDDVKVYIENPNLNPSLHKHTAMYGLNQALKVAQDVGRVKEQAQLLIDWLNAHRLKPVEIKPSKASGTKIKSPYFNKITKYKGRTNEHGRDAAMLVFGK